MTALRCWQWAYFLWGLRKIKNAPHRSAIALLAVFASISGAMIGSAAAILASPMSNRVKPANLLKC